MTVSRSTLRAWQGVVVVLAILLLVAFFTSKCELVQGSFGLGDFWSCKGPLGFEHTVSGTTDSEFQARLIAFGLEVLVGGGILAILGYALQSAIGKLSDS
jgi:hypothetical protein